MKRRTMSGIVFAMLLTHCIAACALFQNKDLPENRRVKTVIFPVRSLRIENVVCIQELEQLTLSGTMTNSSLAPVWNTRLNAIVFFAREGGAENFEIVVDPYVLEPGQSTEFLLSTEVEQTIAYVELHIQWEARFPLPPPPR